MIRFDNVSKRYESGLEALKRVNFELEAGEMAFLTGPSGAGKSTLLKLLMLMERPSSGTLLINGKNLNRLSRSSIPSYRRQIGVVFQNHQLLSDRTVFDNVALPLQILGYPTSETGRRVRAALDGVGLLDKEGNNPLTLSGGEQQRVAIARAYVTHPKLLLADEPTGNLDSENSNLISKILFDYINEEKASLIIVTHDNYLASQTKRKIKIKDGRIV